MTSAENLRNKAEKCRRLSRGQDAITMLALIALADEYDAEALALETTVVVTTKINAASP